MSRHHVCLRQVIIERADSKFESCGSIIDHEERVSVIVYTTKGQQRSEETLELNLAEAHALGFVPNSVSSAHICPLPAVTMVRRMYDNVPKFLTPDQIPGGTRVWKTWTGF